MRRGETERNPGKLREQGTKATESEAVGNESKDTEGEIEGWTEKHWEIVRVTKAKRMEQEDGKSTKRNRERESEMYEEMESEPRRETRDKLEKDRHC